LKTIEEIREAALLMHRVATGRSNRSYMSIPADPSRDADLILGVAIDELEELRREKLRLLASLAESRAACVEAVAAERERIAAFIPMLAFEFEGNQRPMLVLDVAANAIRRKEHLRSRPSGAEAATSDAFRDIPGLGEIRVAATSEAPKPSEWNEAIEAAEHVIRRQFKCRRHDFSNCPGAMAQRLREEVIGLRSLRRTKGGESE
jgi:hypothetical protein